MLKVAIAMILAVAKARRPNQEAKGKRDRVVPELVRDRPRPPRPIVAAVENRGFRKEPPLPSNPRAKSPGALPPFVGRKIFQHRMEFLDHSPGGLIDPEHLLSVVDREGSKQDHPQAKEVRRDVKAWIDRDARAGKHLLPRSLQSVPLRRRERF